ncbi:hypothetical protein AAVH_21704 [Aphelenchoides avenae]|nr:hypothetical protein AAVH_21704 [Aphelenchus avenae]
MIMMPFHDSDKIMKAEFAVRGPSHAKWHEYCKEQTHAIMMRIAVSFFGDHGPEHVEQRLLKITDVLHSYNDKQQAFVNKIFKRLMKLLGKGTTIYISRVMIGRVDKEGISYCYIMAVRVGESPDSGTRHHSSHILHRPRGKDTYCLTGGVLGDASVLAKVTGYRLSVKVLGAVAVAAGAPLANAAAVGFVGDGRLAPQHEAVVIAMSVFAATNILLSKDQAQQVCMIVSEEGAQAEGVSVEKVGKFVEGLFRQAGLGFDAPELPFIAANEIRKFTEGLNEATANDILQSVVNKCKDLKTALAAIGQNVVVPAVASGQHQTHKVDEKRTD